MLNYVDIAFALLFSQNLLLVFAFAFGADPKTFSRPKQAFYTGLCMTGFLAILAPLSRLVYGFLEHYSITQFQIFAYTLLGIFGTYGLGLLLERISGEIWRVMGDSIRSLPSNGGILAVLFLCGQKNYSWQEAFVFGLFGGIGVLVSLVSLVGIRQNSEFDHSPACFQGMPILFMTAGLMSLAFMGYYGFHITYTPST